MSAPDGGVPRRVARVAAQAKINLRLRILAREESGFHQIETLFLRLVLADDVVVRPTDGVRSLDIAGPVDPRQLGPVEKNLAWRAAEMYSAGARWPAGFGIELTKQIPVGGGLGGGSADAAAVLRALDALNPTPMGEDWLRWTAARLGADVPFLVTTQPFALGFGRGERLLALPAPPQREVLLVLPSFGINTAEAYGWLAASRAGADGTSIAGELLELAALARWSDLAPLAENDFEPIVAARHPQITTYVERLRSANCTIAMMSGSGSTVFGVLPADGHVDLPQFASEGNAPAPHVLLTRTAERVEPVTVAE